ncbi:MAG: hypothetical protein CM1200mP26_08480 [Acidimicrobiales bacterium]|nr:MAG: hypothetical protein CM1200mP26_08480 [Acidimicrobiales bacterium]
MKTVLVLASLRDLHEGFAWVMVIGNGLAGYGPCRPTGSRRCGVGHFGGSQP